MSLRKCTINGVLLVLACLGCAIVFAQKTTHDFTSQWKKIDDFVAKGLTKSALTEVDKIYSYAKSAGDDPQVLKALLYKITLQQDIEEDASVKSIDSLEKDITVSKEPAKAILESITAEIYWNYFQQNRYKIYNRTNTINFDKKDIATWTGDDLHNKIGDLYLASLKDKILLQQTRPASFDAIIKKGNVRYLRPSLYDLLAHRALDYFKSDERDITRPAYAFEINDKKVFAPASEFVAYKFETKDSASLHQKALSIFQDVLAFHLNETNPAALIDADIERIDFAHQYAVMANKDSLYIAALNTIAEKYKNNPASAQAAFLRAQFMYNDASMASADENKISKYSIKQAKEILDEIAKVFPYSEGGINAGNLINQILHLQISLSTEKVNVPGLPFRTLVSYKNFSTIYFRVVPLTHEEKERLKDIGDNAILFQKLTNEKSMKEWKQELPATSDYITHSAEVKIDALPVGEYLLMGSAAANFSLDKNPLAATYFYVSDISFINNKQEYFVLNRTTGQPVKGAQVQLYTQTYDYNTRKNKLQQGKLVTTDNNGYFKLPLPEKNENNIVTFDITYKKDRLFLDDLQYTYNYYNSGAGDDSDDQKDYDEDNAKVFLFTDRSIYRPGQLVYFKGIGVTKDWKTKKSILLATKDSITVFLSDANNQYIDSLKVTLNDFGSFNGKFRLPENKLNGAFDIKIDDYKNSDISFSVEEYKRPKFYTAFDTVKGSYRLGDTVRVTGSAKAYAGNNIDRAKVSYRVTRVARFLYPWMFWRTIMPLTQPLEIAHGEMTTDVDGKFIIQFGAIPDLSVNKNTDPVFDYKVEADVTDINGETRSGDITVPVGYKSLNLQINLSPDEAINIDSLKTIPIISKNLSGQPEAVKAEVNIYKLQAPDRLIRQRLWNAPDTFAMSKNEFIQYFPHDEYRDETKKESWNKGQVAYSNIDSTNTTGKWQLAKDKFQQGWYVAEATAKDKNGQEVKDVKYFQVYDPKSTVIPVAAYLWNHLEKNYLEPGETAHLISGTSANDLFLIQQIDKATNVNNAYGNPASMPNFEYNHYTLNHSNKIFDFKLKEEDRGGFGVNQFFVKDNRFYLFENTIYVPWSNKDLNISFDTYRDKTIPGSEEKWKVKITGNKGEKVAAEMLASMYDASLDQFEPHSWDALDVWPTYNNNSQWTASQNFSSVQSFEKYWSEKYFEQKEKNYDALNYLPQTNVRIMLRGIASGAPARLRQDKVMEQLDINKSNLKQPTQVQTIESTPPKIEADEEVLESKNENSLNPSQIQIRKNFNETAFFFPELRTDKDGNIEFSFTMPEALTQWKLMTLAHTKDLASGYAEKTVLTQKDLMVQPNPPRFLREGDRMEFSAKIVNLTDKELSGQSEFHLLNASTMNPLDSWFKNTNPSKSFTVGAGQSTLVTFNIEVPSNFNDAVVYRIVAKAGNLSDGEEAAIPVITNRMLVTETLPLPMRGDGSKDFKFEKLINSESSHTLNSYGLTVEYTTNPAWYAIQALPYLMEYPYECAEQTFNRYYANALATKIVNSSPKIKAIFEKWKITDTAALMSNLQKNEELKSVLLQETPWVLQAQSEEQQKKNIALLFDMTKMSLQLQSALDKLTDMQSSNGGFVWFKGGPDNRYMTQYILTGIGHLEKLNASPSFQQTDIATIVNAAIPYLDKMITKDYNDLLKYKTKLDQDNLSAIAIQYLYMRSFFPEYPINKEMQTAYKYYRDQSGKYWLKQSKYMQAMIALELYRSKDGAAANAIIKSLKENSINNDELGMYWKEWDQHGYWWYQAPIESQAIMIEAFSEIEKDPKTTGDLKTWLLKTKQTNNWNTTKATAEACYALLLQGTDWLSSGKNS